jgi:ABC-type multidrug transport system ATPase subunit
VIINAIILGLSRKQALARFEEILAFAELEEFVDLKLKNYSSGMYVRLAFATAVQVDADILLIDEVLAVGDAAFQRKCFDEFNRLKAAGRTMLFVTHDMAAVERFCDRALLLERGHVVDIGAPADIARQYNQLNFAQIRAKNEGLSLDHVELPQRQAAEILNAWFESPDGDIALTAKQGDPCIVRMEVRFHTRIEGPIFIIALHNEASQTVFATTSQTQDIATGCFEPGTTARVCVRFDNRLAPGRYRLLANVARPIFGADIADAHISNSIVVLADRPGGGIADLPHSFEIERA